MDGLWGGKVIEIEIAIPMTAVGLEKKESRRKRQTIYLLLVNGECHSTLTAGSVSGQAMVKLFSRQTSMTVLDVDESASD